MAAENNIEKPILPGLSELAIAKTEPGESLINKIEKPVVNTEEVNEVLSVKATPAVKVVSQPPQSMESRRAAEIDKILEDGLSEVFLKMSPKEQKIFQEKGIETVSKINALLGQAKVNIDKIFDLIRGWLKLIPGINKFFLEQETKIKADKIIGIGDRL